MAMLDYTGMKFGMLTVLGEADRIGKDRRVIAQCECGNTKVFQINNIKNGHTKSCGCAKIRAGKIRATHGHARKGCINRTYSIYRDMITRCTNKNYKEFHLYGGRGITICDRWMQGYEYFLADMGERPDGLSIDRIDVNNGYSPDNCKWATNHEQANNKRNSAYIEYMGKKQTIAQWAEDIGIKAGTIYKRIYNGYTPEQALCETLHSGKKV